MSKVILTVGVAGSGKTIWAKNYVNENAGYVNVNRDDLRATQGFPPVGSNDQEKIVTKLQRGQIETALLDGYSVIVSDTNLNKQIRQGLVDYVHKLGFEVEFVYEPFDVSLPELLKRNFERGLEKFVPENVIRKQHQRFEQLKSEGFVKLVAAPVEVYAQHVHVGNEPVYSVDLDGTVAEGNRRSPYDYSKVIEDEPIANVVTTVKSLAKSAKIVFVSGRTDECREQTQQWIDMYIGPGYDLFMRKAGDQRPDYIIKNEIYDEQIIPNYDIIACLDDRQQVVTHLRNRGITVFQVAQGRF